MQNSYEDEKKNTRKIAIIEADIESACIEHGVRGHLRHEDIERMIAEIDEDEKQARVYGKFAHLVGLVFKKWTPSVHIIAPFEINHNDFLVYHALDTHLNTPYAGLWIAVDPYGRKYVVDELWRNIESEEELALTIRAKNEKYRMGRMWIEPGADIKEQSQGMTSLKQRLQQNYGLYYELGSKERTACVQRIKKALEYNEVGGKMVKYPEMYSFSTCERFNWEMARYVYDEWKGRTKEKKDPKEKPIDKDDHLIEDCGRILIEEPDFYLPLRQSEVEQTVDNTVKNMDPYS